MSLKNQITEDMKSAMKAGDKDRLKVVRLIMAAIKQVEVDSRSELDDAGVLGVLEKMVKQRRDSVEQFENGGRNDLAAAGAESIRDMGMVMGQIKAKAAGRADMGTVSATVKDRLNAL